MIHRTAIIGKEVVLEESVEIGAYAIIERGVKIGKNVHVNPHAHIKGDTQIGDNTFIGTGAIIGEAPQILGFAAKGGSSSENKENIGKVRIGDNNVIREYVTVHASSSKDASTHIGDNNYLMGFSHIAHDCNLGNNTVVCNGALIAGHVEIQDNAFISGNVVVHQFVRIGRLAMVGGLARVNQDVPPFMMVVGDSKVWGLNTVGLKRKSFGVKEIKEIRKAFNILYRSKYSQSNAVKRLEGIESAQVKEIVDFIASSKRGICGPSRNTLFEKIFLDYPYFLRNKISTYNLFLKTISQKS
jgi:UDP-N-acetylglucosamine acyltransferase